MSSTPATDIVTEAVKPESLADHGIHSASRSSIGQWDLWTQCHPGSSGYGPSISIMAKVVTDGSLCGAEMTLPPEVVFALGELIAELREKMGQTPEVFAGKTVDAWLR